MQLTPDALALGLVWFVIFLFSTTVHEAAHALVALRLGDSTAYRGGQVTLNPIPHIQREPMGTIGVPIVTYLLSGWMMGWASAPYDPWWADRYPRRAAWMALAGPVSNLLLFVSSALMIRLGMLVGLFEPPQEAYFSQVTAALQSGVPEALATCLSILFSLNLLLFAFNLLPLPPLDGSGVLPLVMKETVAVRYQELMRQPTWSLLGIVLAWYMFRSVYGPLHLIALNLLYPEVGYH